MPPALRAQRRQRVEARIEADQLGNVLGGIEVVDQVIAGPVVAEDENIGAIVAGQIVIPASAVDDVGRVPADHDIVALPAEEPVGGGGVLRRCREGADEVVAGAAVDLVGRNVAAQDGVVAADRRTRHPRSGRSRR